LGWAQESRAFGAEAEQVGTLPAIYHPFNAKQLPPQGEVVAGIVDPGQSKLRGRDQRSRLQRESRRRAWFEPRGTARESAERAQRNRRDNRNAPSAALLGNLRDGTSGLREGRGKIFQRRD